MRDPIGFGLIMSAVAVSTLVVVAAAHGATEPGGTATGAWQPVEAFGLSAGSAKGNYTALVEKNSDSDDSPRLTIMGLRGAALSVRPPGGLTPVAEALKFSHSLQANSLTARYLYTSPNLRSRFLGRLFIAFGWAYASDPGSIRVIALGHGRPAVIFEDDTFALEDVVNLRRGSELWLIGHRSLSQEYGNCLATYDPFTVFRLSSAAGFKYSSALSRRYNLDHGYVWAGPNGHEDIAVDHCGPRPRLMRGAELKRRD